MCARACNGFACGCGNAVTMQVDGLDFGIQSRYIEVVVTGIPHRLHSQGRKLVSTLDGGEPTGGAEEVCCGCDWYCSSTSGLPRTCRCRSPGMHTKTAL